MNESLEETACLYVLDQLAPDERSVFESRLLREPGLAALVGELETNLARGIHALPPQPPSAATLARIEQRLDALTAAEGVTAENRRPGTIRWVSFARWGIAATIAISLATLAVQSLRRRSAPPSMVFVGLNANQNTFTEVPLSGSVQDPDARFIQLASLAENFWNKPANQPVRPVPVSGDNRGYALFDPGSQQGFIAIEQLPVIAENQRYHLWIIDPGTNRIRDAGVLPLSGTNRGLYSFTLGAEQNRNSARPIFFITAEENGPAPQPVQPRGKVVLGNRSI